MVLSLRTVLSWLAAWPGPQDSALPLVEGLMPHVSRLLEKGRFSGVRRGVHTHTHTHTLTPRASSPHPGQQQAVDPAAPPAPLQRSVGWPSV